ncbi:hypothetical protein A0H81_01886 [Grifola frondosa]|uniref:Uncharacterized protein n=1 Tax=Grifola frondosa TaxID=5627 RepID=A0A1C7MT59_GRIFR|nr:hypothetical protein A0H81_01886 [Grifola frondosa]
MPHKYPFPTKLPPRVSNTSSGSGQTAIHVTAQIGRAEHTVEVLIPMMNDHLARHLIFLSTPGSRRCGHPWSALSVAKRYWSEFFEIRTESGRYTIQSVFRVPYIKWSPGRFRARFELTPHRSLTRRANSNNERQNIYLSVRSRNCRLASIQATGPADSPNSGREFTNAARPTHSHRTRTTKSVDVYSATSLAPPYECRKDVALRAEVLENDDDAADGDEAALTRASPRTGALADTDDDDRVAAQSEQHVDAVYEVYDDAEQAQDERAHRGRGLRAKVTSLDVAGVALVGAGGSRGGGGDGDGGCGWREGGGGAVGRGRAGPGDRKEGEGEGEAEERESTGELGHRVWIGRTPMSAASQCKSSMISYERVVMRPVSARMPETKPATIQRSACGCLEALSCFCDASTTYPEYATVHVPGTHISPQPSSPIQSECAHKVHRVAGLGSRRTRISEYLHLHQHARLPRAPRSPHAAQAPVAATRLTPRPVISSSSLNKKEARISSAWGFSEDDAQGGGTAECDCVWDMVPMRQLDARESARQSLRDLGSSVSLLCMPNDAEHRAAIPKRPQSQKETSEHARATDALRTHSARIGSSGGRTALPARTASALLPSFADVLDEAKDISTLSRA